MPDITITVTDAQYADIKESIWRTGSKYSDIPSEGINSTDDVTDAHIIAATKNAIMDSTGQALVYKAMDNA